MTDAYSLLLIGLKEPALNLAREHFVQGGHRVDCVGGTSEAAERLKEGRHDLVYLQPASDAEAEAMAEFRQILALGLPVVLICTKATGTLTLDAWHAGAADVVILPLTPRSLEASLQRAIKRLPGRKPTQGEESQARFRYLDESGKERWAAIVPPKFTIGRSATNDLVLSKMSISRAHAEVVVKGGEFFLQDLGSRHGTYINGVRVEGPNPVRLGSGSNIQLGGSQGQSLTFHTGDLLQTLLGVSHSSPETGLSVRGFREMGMLLATFRALSSIPLLDDLLSLVVDTAIELTGAERGFIMLKEQDNALEFRCARNKYKRPLDGSYFQTSQRVPDEVFRTGRRVVINDLESGADLQDHSSTRRLGLRSIFCVPMKYHTFRDAGNLSASGQAETIGILYVDSQTIGAGLSTTQIETLESLASEASLAIYNARLYRDSQEKQKLEEELAIAREIQQALLPTPEKILPFAQVFSRNLPCREVGGDYFDYFDMQGGRLGFALGDVSGKGMPAALLTSVIQGIFSAQALLDLPLPAMMSNLNRNLVRRGTSSRFVTFFFGILDSEGKCTYSNAGHNPPYVLGSDGSLRELTEGGMVLGLFATATYESATIQLKPGDHLVLFTDGVLEALNVGGEEFGVERLRALLQQHARASSAEILTALQEAVTNFSANTPQHDDITMMVLGFQEI